MPSQMTQGVDDAGYVNQPWGLTQGRPGWRSPPADAKIMARAVRIVREPGEPQRLFENRRYGPVTDPTTTHAPAGATAAPSAGATIAPLVPQWLPRTELSDDALRTAMSFELREGQSLPAAEPRPTPRGEHAEQPPPRRPIFTYVERPHLPGPLRPDRNPLRLDCCLPIPFEQRGLGSCGHPSCRRAAEWVGLNRVCDGCGAYDPDCALFYCDGCLPHGDDQ